QEKDYPEIVTVWEASVRATHHFVLDEDIRFYKDLISYKYLKQANLLCIRDDENGRIQGFLGVHEDYVDMLFIHPDYFGKGVGTRLLKHALENLGATKVSVNEQNEKALHFYKKFGFKTMRRDERDGMDMPYPILHMELS
ncbi:MAG TPA: GNAT family N-acetyltransferase, partial [Patescibacteria group bacterium]|nr:GNAT family N-acetyltransferase [Patescibacteria group bacterium]